MMTFFNGCIWMNIKNLCASDQDFFNHFICSFHFAVFGKAKERSQFCCSLELLLHLLRFSFIFIPTPNYFHPKAESAKWRNVNWLLLLILSILFRMIKLLLPTISTQRANYLPTPKVTCGLDPEESRRKPIL